jgi:hypothetical protein
MKNIIFNVCKMMISLLILTSAILILINIKTETSAINEQNKLNRYTYIYNGNEGHVIYTIDNQTGIVYGGTGKEFYKITITK